MPQVRLVQVPIGCPPDDAVQQLHLLQVRRVSAEAPFDFAHELLVHLPLHDVQVGIVARGGEAAPVHDAPH
eukprot:7779886-Alexandrium_andersonii.AAC.1